MDCCCPPPPRRRKKDEADRKITNAVVTGSLPRPAKNEEEEEEERTGAMGPARREMHATDVRCDHRRVRDAEEMFSGGGHGKHPLFCPPEDNLAVNHNIWWTNWLEPATRNIHSNFKMGTIQETAPTILIHKSGVNRQTRGSYYVLASQSLADPSRTVDGEQLVCSYSRSVFSDI